MRIIPRKSRRAVFYDANEVAVLLERTPTRVRQLIANGEIPAVRVGGRLRVPVEAFEQWIDEQTERALSSAGMRDL